MKGSIYQIYTETNPNIHYIGSTMSKLSKRWKGHLDGYNQYLLDRSEIVSIYPYFESLGIENFKYRLIKEYDVVDKYHLLGPVETGLAYEQLWINKLKPINIQKYLFKTRHIQKALDRIKYNNNKERILNNCKKYYQKNIETIKERNRTYRENNIEKIKERKTKKYICPCTPDKELNFEHKSRHNRTLKHIKFLESQETKE